MKKYLDIKALVDDWKADARNLHYVTWMDMKPYEVEAIPIEWLEQNYGWLTMTGEIIKDWRKTNEID